MKIFLDACSIIYWIEMAQPQYHQFATLIQRLGKKYDKPLFAASHLSLLECRVKPLREKNEELLERYQAFFCATDLTLVPMTPAVLDHATRLRAFHHLRIPDAIQAASALSISEGTIFVTGDKSFKNVPKLKLALI